MNINEINERDNRYVMAWRNLSDEEKFRNLPVLATDYYIHELICSMQDDSFKLFAHTAYAKERPNLNQEIFVTSLICSLQSDNLKKQYIDSLQEEHSKSAVLASMHDTSFMEEKICQLKDGVHKHYVRTHIEKLEK